MNTLGVRWLAWAGCAGAPRLETPEPRLMVEAAEIAQGHKATFKREEPRLRAGWSTQFALGKKKARAIILTPGSPSRQWRSPRRAQRGSTAHL